MLQNSKGEYVLLNEDVYKVSKNGNLNINMSEKKKYVLLNKDDMQKLTNEILETATLKNKKSTVEEGKRTKVEFSKEFDMKNVAKITYSSADKALAVVSKNGSIRTKKAGKVVIKAKVTLKNGTTKTLKMTINVK